jgi:MHS family proline/betaine transporter-like MFS transporter
MCFSHYREKIVIAASFGFLVLSQPFFYFLSYDNYEVFLLIESLISIPAGAYYATVPVILAEMFPLNLRCTVLSVLYSTAASLSAGLAPLLSLMLIRLTGNPMSPAILVIALVIISLIIMRLKRLKCRKLEVFA